MPHRFAVGALANLLLLAGGAAGFGDEEGRVGIATAGTLVRRHVMQANPKMNPAVEIPLLEVTPDATWETLRIQIFRVTDGLLESAAFAVAANDVIPLTERWGGDGILSLLVADIDGDRQDDLVYTYSWGSGVDRTELAALVRTTTGWRRLGSRFAYRGEMIVQRQGQGAIVVRAADWKDRRAPLYDREFIAREELGIVTFQDTPEGGELQVRMHDDLPAAIEDKVWNYSKER